MDKNDLLHMDKRDLLRLEVRARDEKIARLETRLAEAESERDAEKRRAEAWRDESLSCGSWGEHTLGCRARKGSPCSCPAALDAAVEAK